MKPLCMTTHIWLRAPESERRSARDVFRWALGCAICAAFWIVLLLIGS